MQPIVDPRIEEYSRKHSEPESALLRELVRVTHKNTALPQMQVGHLEGSFLRFLARWGGAKRVLEIGTFTGYSALCFAEGMERGGSVITCDIDPESADIAKSFWKRSPHGRKITLKLGPALQTIKSLKGPFDLVFIDADKANYARYWDAVLPKVRKGGLIVADNVLWSGRVLSPKDDQDKTIAAFNKKVASDKRVTPLMLPVRDGITLALKK